MARVQPDSITGLLPSARKKALLIAVKDNMKDLNKLRVAWRDAEELKRLLIATFGYSAENIVLMKDSKSVSEEFWPTKKRIREQIKYFVRDVSPGDHLFFSYSGHGHQVPCHHHTELDGLEEVITTCDGKEIIDNDLKKWLVEPLPPGCKLFALWDSCHSQTILDLEHTVCNEPKGEQQSWQHRESGSQSMFRQALPKCLRRNANILKSAVTIVPHRFRGRSIARASVSITAVSAGNSPPLSKWTPFSMNIPRVLSPLSWFPCNGKCPLPVEGEVKRACVISLSACKDDQSAFDDACNGTFSQFFIDHLSERPDIMRRSLHLQLTQGTNPNSTLLELLLAMRRRVDEVTAARRAWDMETGVISRRSTTFASDRRVETQWTPHVIRRSTEVVVDTPEELFRFTPSSAREKNKCKYPQKPSYSSQYRLNLDDLVDL